MKYPPGFTPKEGSEEIDIYAEESKSVNLCQLSGHKARGSILNLMDELVKAGQVMGYKMDGLIYRCYGNYLTYEIGIWKGDGRWLIMGEIAMSWLKFLKAKIREWNKSNMLSVKNVKAKYKEELEALEAIIDRGDGNEEIVNKRTEVVNNIQKFDKIHSSEMAQKAKLGNEVIDRVKNRLSKWKMKTLSIRGRLTLLKSVLGSIPIFHMSIYRAPLNVLRTLESIQSKFFKGYDINSNKASWVNWKKVLASKEKGCLGAIHGDDGNVGGHVKYGAKSCWLDIEGNLRFLNLDILSRDHGGDLNWLLVAKLAQPSLEYSFRRNPRGGVEQDQFNELSALVHHVSLIPMSNKWKWDLESSGDFSVASVRKIIDDKSLSDVDSKTRWIKYVPIKVNVHAWKVKTNSFPTRLNVSIMCAICDNGVETSRHLFFYCCMVRQIIHKITRWWDVPYVDVESYEDWYNWLVNLRISSMHKQMFQGVFYVMWWHLWSFRNKLIFDSKPPSQALFLMM
ncbi:RNA-directed DNA polymerase, eukaryota, reverse transcriptase zinc-binding domain protein [Tanacetum coccineum]